MLLFKVGAKRVYHANSSNKELVTIVKERLLSDYQSANDANGMGN